MIEIHKGDLNAEHRHLHMPSLEGVVCLIVTLTSCHTLTASLPAHLYRTGSSQTAPQPSPPPCPGTWVTPPPPGAFSPTLHPTPGARGMYPKHFYPFLPLPSPFQTPLLRSPLVLVMWFSAWSIPRHTCLRAFHPPDQTVPTRNRSWVFHLRKPSTQHSNWRAQQTLDPHQMLPWLTE